MLKSIAALIGAVKDMKISQGFTVSVNLFLIIIAVGAALGIGYGLCHFLATWISG